MSNRGLETEKTEIVQLVKTVKLTSVKEYRLYMLIKRDGQILTL